MNVKFIYWLSCQGIKRGSLRFIIREKACSNRLEAANCCILQFSQTLKTNLAISSLSSNVDCKNTRILPPFPYFLMALCSSM